jgi:hypothetical protein
MFGAMTYGIRKGLEDVAQELKGIRNILHTFWSMQSTQSENASLNPEMYADEYISTEECARRLDISDQTIRNWMQIGRKNPDRGWIEGVHYINVNPDHSKKAVFRIPWNQYISSFAKNRKPVKEDYEKCQNPLYKQNPMSLEAELS